MGAQLGAVARLVPATWGTLDTLTLQISQIIPLEKSVLVNRPRTRSDHTSMAVVYKVFLLPVRALQHRRTQILEPSLVYIC